MPSKSILAHTVVFLALLAASPAFAGDLGQLIAAEVDVGWYQHYLDNELFTHAGDNRGRTGPDHDPARANILAILTALGLEAQLEPFTYSGGTYYNVVAVKRGYRYPAAQYIVGAHFDSASTPGADDNASGVAGVLELARVLSQHHSEYSLVFVAFDLEELGLRGSQAYVVRHAADDIRGMISLDMIAHDAGNYSMNIHGYTASTPWKNSLAAAISEYGGDLGYVLGGGLCLSDHCPFEQAGRQACVLIENSYSANPCYHQACDSVDQPNYIDYYFAADGVRSVGGLLADKAVVRFTGDLNCDGTVNTFDIQPFVTALADPAAYGALFPACSVEMGDTNRDGTTNPFDIAGFVDLLTP